MKIVFLGSPEFAVPALEKLAEHHDVIAVVTQPDRRAGRGRKMKGTPVSEAAVRLGLDVFKPSSPRSEDGQELLKQLQELSPEAFVVAAYSHFLPRSWRRATPLGCLNIHPSLLPRWRGAAPAQWTIAEGDEEAGVCIIRLVKKMDAGPILGCRRTSVLPGEDGGELLTRLAEEGAALLIELLEEPDKMAAKDQSEEGITFARALNRDDSKIDWSLGADAIVNKIRAFRPWPGTAFEHRGLNIKVHDAEKCSGNGSAPGTVISSDSESGLVVSTGHEAVKLLILQAPGKKPLNTDVFLRGYSIESGEVLG